MRQALKHTVTRLGLLPAARQIRRFLRRSSPQQMAKIRRSKARRRRLEELYASMVASGDLVFDIGANLGVRVEIFRGLGARVIAAEPHELCLETLRRKFADDPEVVLVPAGLGAEKGEHEFFVSSDIQTSSMSKAWIDSVSGRLDAYTWQERRMVEITTLDALIETHGMPVFCKIDVEGFEHQVLRGLSRPIPCLSLEYTPEHLAPTMACVDHLASIGPYELNYSAEEDFELAHRAWLSADELKVELESVRSSGRSGDVYARLRRQ